MIYGIIPARYASTRLPGKPLAKIAGKPMIQWVYESAKHSKLVNDLIVATDDRRVFEAVEAFGGNVVMTPDDIKTGSDRIAFVAKELSDCTIVVNIQGDEPFIPGMMIDQAIEPWVFF
jgi:3-deoxy-manno-octulosonate cytidylyltransferase (CMP-KDO synthetase)